MQMEKKIFIIQEESLGEMMLLYVFRVIQYNKAVWSASSKV